MAISVPVISTPPASMSSDSLPTRGHTITDPPMIHAASTKEDSKPLPIATPSNRYTKPTRARARQKKKAAITRIKQHPSYKNSLTNLLTSNDNNSLIPKEPLPLDQLPPPSSDNAR